MSGPIETTGLLFVAGVAVIAAAFVVPLPKPKPEPTPKPPEYERLAPSPAEAEQVSRIAPETEPPPSPPTETDDHRIRALEQSVHEIQKDQQELKDEIRALVEEVKAK